LITGREGDGVTTAGVGGGFGGALTLTGGDDLSGCGPTNTSIGAWDVVTNVGETWTKVEGRLNDGDEAGYCGRTSL
jgi:hypothetical protein